MSLAISLDCFSTEEEDAYDCSIESTERVLVVLVEALREQGQVLVQDLLLLLSGAVRVWELD